MLASTARLLEAGGFEIVSKVSEAGAAIQAAERHRPDLCLLLGDLAGGTARAVREIARRLPDTPVVVLTAEATREELIDLIRAGAAGYLPKDMNPERLPHALRGVLAGEASIPRKLIPDLLMALRTQDRRRSLLGHAGRVELTVREWESLELLCNGLDTAEIAERLYVSPVTVRRHLAAVTRKLGVRSRGEAVALVEGELAPGGTQES